MNYIRTTSGSMIAIGPKTKAVIAVKKQATTAKAVNNDKKAAVLPIK